MLSFAPDNPELGTLELSQRLGIHKSTVSRLLHLLADNNFLKQNLETKKYSLGRSVAEIGNAVIKSLDNGMGNIAQPYLKTLSEIVGESVSMEVLNGTDVVLGSHVEGQRHIRFSFNIGEQVAINAAAGAKAILAYCPTELVNQCLKRKFLRFNANTIVSKRSYRAILEEVRATGIAYDRGERHEDSHAIATPIFNHESNPVAAVVIAGPAFRMTTQFLNDAIDPLKKTAAVISQHLFY